MTLQELSQSSIIKKETYDLSVRDLWSKWTTRDGLKSFFGAENQIELNVHGKFEIYFLMEAPEGSRGSEGCQILSLLPERMLSFSWNAPPHLAARHSGIYTHVVILFHAVSEMKSSLELHHLGWPEDERYLEVYTYFDQAWQYVLDRLHESASNL